MNQIQLSRTQKLALFIGGLLLLFVLARVFKLDAWLVQIQPWIQSLGSWGPLAFIALYVVATVLAIPGSAITLLGAVLFGSLYGTIYVSIGSTLGAAACFVIARYLARDALNEKLSNQSAFQNLLRLTEQHGMWLVAITRLIPLFPFNLLNYGFGLTQISFGTYVFWSWLCMLPGTILYVAGTDVVVQALKEGKVSWPLLAMVVAMFTFLILFSRRFKQKMELSHEPN